MIEALGIMKSQMKEFGITARFEGLREMQEATVGVAVKALSEIQQYRAIGTVEECREARERQIPKKTAKYGDTRQGLDNDGNSISRQEDCYECPTCGSFLGYVSDCEDEEYQGGYCQNCGQAISRESDTP